MDLTKPPYDETRLCYFKVRRSLDVLDVIGSAKMNGLLKNLREHLEKTWEAVRKAQKRDIEVRFREFRDELNKLRDYFKSYLEDSK